MHVITRNALGIVTVLLATWFFLLAVTNDFGEDSLSAWWPVALIASDIALLAGLWFIQRSPWTGCALLTIGALPLGIITLWAIFPPVLALTVVALAFRRAGAQTDRPTQLEAA